MFFTRNTRVDLSNGGNTINGNDGRYWGTASLGDTEYTTGKLSFSCKLDKGNSAVIGVGSKSSDLTGYYPLSMVANQRGLATTKAFSSPVVDTSIVTGDIITTDIDFDAGTMCYKKNGVAISARFDDLNSLAKPLYVLCQVVPGSALSLCDNTTAPDPHEWAPQNLTLNPGDSQISLSWTAGVGAKAYNVKRSTTVGGPYTTIATNVTGTTFVDNTVTNGTTYYYVVTALDGSGNESATSNEASAMPIAAPVESGISLLQVTMNNSNEREYELSTAEIEGFVNWFNNYTSAAAKSYMLNKTVGKEYLAFDKIISFEVIPLTK
ncbi:hypothetical protein [Pelosinus sp. IPA-1]|uniref:hypothetical protein n=1 Tax=Pelosinus sp. IPA-1 TaxID=3029569 RepID=UPI0024362933|nr:hypothetical protein [Pelosinus sp. IPA-1]GMB01471.1 hypothetical protein PIPA1_42700 [Pelosinus sp. IPA-1]